MFAYAATNFTPAIDSRLTGLELPLAVVSGPTDIDVLLLGDSGNLPGSVIESFHLTGFTLAGPVLLIPIASTLHPLLDAGTQYWVAVTGGTQTTFAVWSLTLFTGDPMAGGAGRSIVNGVDSGWIRKHGYSSGRRGDQRRFGSRACFRATHRNRFRVAIVQAQKGVPPPGSLALRPVTRSHPNDGFVSWLHSHRFLRECNPSYGVLTLSPVGLSPTEHASLRWSHYGLKNRMLTVLPLTEVTWRLLELRKGHPWPCDKLSNDFV